MRRTYRLLASVKPTASQFLEPGAPTGLTGLRTHPSPRSTLVFLYRGTLDKLQALPEHSVYRQSTEAVTRHRLAAVEAAEPAGYADWLARATQLLHRHPDQFAVERTANIDGAAAWRAERGGSVFLVRRAPPRRDQRDVEWDGEIDEGPELEGTRTAEERADQVLSATRRPLEDREQVEWEDEPRLTAEQYVVPPRSAPPGGDGVEKDDGGSQADGRGLFLVGSRRLNTRLARASSRRSYKSPRGKISWSTSCSSPRCKRFPFPHPAK